MGLEELILRLLQPPAHSLNWWAIRRRGSPAHLARCRGNRPSPCSPSAFTEMGDRDLGRFERRLQRLRLHHSTCEARFTTQVCFKILLSFTCQFLQRGVICYGRNVRNELLLSCCQRQLQLHCALKLVIVSYKRRPATCTSLKSECTRKLCSTLKLRLISIEN